MNSSPSVFLSYSREDTAFAESMAVLLSQYGASVWLDRNEIAPGEDWVSAIERAMTESDVTFLLVSPRYQSESFSNYERALALKLAEEGRTKLVPVLLPGTLIADLPHSLRGFSIIDATGSPKETAQQFERALSAAS